MYTNKINTFNIMPRSIVYPSVSFRCRTAIFTNTHFNDFVKVYFAKTAKYHDNDAYIVSQYLSEEIQPVKTSPVKKHDYTFSSLDSKNEHNIIKNRIFDFGAIYINQLSEDSILNHM